MKTAILLEPPPGYNPDLVKRAAEFVRSGYVDSSEIIEAARKFTAVTRAAKGILPMENIDAAKVLATLKTSKEEYTRLHQQGKIYEFSDGKYMLFDLEPLLWRNKSGFPKLAVFSPSFAEFGFEANLSNPIADFLKMANKGVEVRVTPKLPKQMLDCYADVIKLVQDRTKSGVARASGLSLVIDKVSVCLKARFGGLIPDYVKQEMFRAANSGLFVEFFIIAEVKKWEWNIKVVSHRADPLLVGFDGHQFWLIEAFDTTTLERMVAEEFTAKP
jgi:hypothetical protein